MKLNKHGSNSSQTKNRPEILNLTPYGMWILVSQKEYFIDYSRYPWFLNATMQELREVETTGLGSGIYWPALDIDVELEALEFPERFPLIARNQANGRHAKTKPPKKNSTKIQKRAA